MSKSMQLDVDNSNNSNNNSNNGESEQYKSPLINILSDLRRRHVVAAGVASDVSMNDIYLPSATECICSKLGRVSLFQKSSHLRKSSLQQQNQHQPQQQQQQQSQQQQQQQHEDDICSTCGRRRPFDRNLKKEKEGMMTNQLLAPSSGPPRHADLLLLTTPHLRHLPASIESSSSSSSNNRGFLIGFLGTSNDSQANEQWATMDYRTVLLQKKANKEAAAELASFLWVLAHEMSLDNYGRVETEVYTSLFRLVHSQDPQYRLAGVAALDALIETPSADAEKKTIKFANNLSNSLRSLSSDYEFISAVAITLGRRAARASIVDFAESEIIRALEWLQSERPVRRLAAALTLKELAANASTAFYSKTTRISISHGGANEFLDNIFPVLADTHAIVRVCAADSLSQCLKVLMDRQHASLTALLCQVYFSIISGLEASPLENNNKNNSKKKNQPKKNVPTKISAAELAQIECRQHGSLLAVACILEHGREFMLPRFDEICQQVLNFTNHSMMLIRLQVIRLIPRLAKRRPDVFGRRYLDRALPFLLEAARRTTSPQQQRTATIDLQPTAFVAIGQLIAAMNDAGRLIGGSALPTVKIYPSSLTMTQQQQQQQQNNINNPTAIKIEVAKTGIIYQQVQDIFQLVQKGLKTVVSKRQQQSAPSIQNTSLTCAADLVEALGSLADPYLEDLINDMFSSGLSEDLIVCLNKIAISRPSHQTMIEERLLQEISTCLAGIPHADLICNPLCAIQGFRSNFRRRHPMGSLKYVNGRPVTIFITPTDTSNTEKKNTTSTSNAGAPIDDNEGKVLINFVNDTEANSNLVLSLTTLGSFTEKNGLVSIAGKVMPILLFVRNVVAHYLTHPDAGVRRAAIFSCCALLIPLDIITSDTNNDPSHQGSLHVTRKKRLGTSAGQIVEEVLKKLLRVAVSDSSPMVRLCVVHGLDERYDYFLCQSHHLQALFFLLQDEVLANRASGLQLLGRLTSLNPATILPVMRKLLVELIVELKCGVDTGRVREEATRLLIIFLRAEPLQRLVHSSMASIVKAIPLKGSAPRLASAAMEALGELAIATKAELKPWINDLMPQIMETLQDQSSVSKQRMSIKTLGRIAGATGYVIRPYLDYPQLLSQTTDVLPATKRAPWSLRREVIRTLGVVGALDPDQYHTFVPKTRKRGAVGGGYFLERRQGSINNKDTDQQGGNDALLDSEMPRMESRDSDDSMPAYLFMYEQYAMSAQPVSQILLPKRITPSDEDFYPTVAIQALTRIFEDPSLAMHHGMVMQAIMFIFNFLGQKCVPYLDKVIPHMLYSINTCNSSNLREALLKQLSSLSSIVREHLRPYVTDIFEIVDSLWHTKHLGTILTLLSKIATGVPDDFRVYLPRLVNMFLRSLDQVQRSNASDEADKVDLIMKSIQNLRIVLGEYLHLIVPSLLRLVESLILPDDVEKEKSSVTLRCSEKAILTLQTLSYLLAQDTTIMKPQQMSLPSIEWSENSFPLGCSLLVRIVQPLVRLLGQVPPSSKQVGHAIVDVLLICSKQLGQNRWRSLYQDSTAKAIAEWQRQNAAENPEANGMQQGSSGLQNFVSEDINNNSRFPLSLDSRNDSLTEIRQPRIDSVQNLNDAFGLGLDVTLDPLHSDAHFNPSIQPVMNPTSRHNINQGNLQRAWDVSQRASREDWDEWMRRFGIQLLQEAPSPALRATASLAHVYQPLARELFSAAFVCCWEELNEQYRMNLVHALEVAFVADVSPEILQTLLNLAEFMEHDGVGPGLPIDISNLAELALKCRSYAKALHYKEREYNKGSTASGSCVEDLISINKKLDLPEAALGVLKSSQIQVDHDLLSEGMSLDYIPSQFSKRSFSAKIRYSAFSNTDVVLSSANGGMGLAEVRESWLAKLGSWSEALLMYEEKIRRNPNDFEAILGCMRCLDASGEWQRVLDLAEQNWPALFPTIDDFATRMHRILPPPPSSAGIAPKTHRKALKLCAQAAWRLGQWQDLEKYATELAKSSSQGVSTSNVEHPDQAHHPVIDFDGAFYTAVLHIHRKQWSRAASDIDAARRAMDSRFSALMAESYTRAYPSMVTAQILAEMEEIIDYRQLEERAIKAIHRHPSNRPSAERARERLINVWRNRLAGCRIDADVHASILAVRSLVLEPIDDVETTLTLSNLCRQTQRNKLAERVLLDPLRDLGANLSGHAFGFGLSDELSAGRRLTTIHGGVSRDSMIERLVQGSMPEYAFSSVDLREQLTEQILSETGGPERLRIQHRLYFAFLKHLWSVDQRKEAITRLEKLCDVMDFLSHNQQISDNAFVSDCWLELGDYKLEEAEGPKGVITPDVQLNALFAFRKATSAAVCGYKAWHSWALLNFRIAEQIFEDEEGNKDVGVTRMKHHILAAVKGFVSAISRGTKQWSASVQQDMLNLLACLFKYGELRDVAHTINTSMESITLESWLGVLPQLLARIHIRKPFVRSVLHPLLIRLGEKHPQALMYPLSVLLKSPVAGRKNAAETLMNSLHDHSSSLVDEALMVSSELIRVAILWLETWHEGLEDASRLWFGEGNVSGMLELLVQLHEQIETGTETQKENEFVNNFGRKLEEAYSHIKEYIRFVTADGRDIQGKSTSGESSMAATQTNEEADIEMNKAWEIYYTVFRMINKELPGLTKLELSQCSPALSQARTLELGVPGSYRVDGSYVRIEQFIPSVQVITSKQRPRKIVLRGSDGKDYVFLLKGHEDLRQDERVMQLFGLVNALLTGDRQTKKHDLNIQRYAITPLSHNCGVVGWVPHCDTFHSLIREYRQSIGVQLSMENREMLKMAPDYDMLSVMQKVEVFTDALQRTTGKGNDLYEILWLKSANSEAWLERRTRFTRSLAVMSMVGYILGLGDRHPSNLMLDQLSGRVLHIDFGDCFEVAMNREKYPEKIPFRLTRMLVKAMEVSGIEGSYRSTCERTMRVLRGSKDSLVAMLEAFVHDPLISWRLAGLSNKANAVESAVEGLQTSERNETVPADDQTNVPAFSNVVQESIAEGVSEEGDMDDISAVAIESSALSLRGISKTVTDTRSMSVVAASTRARSLQMFTDIQSLAANVEGTSRIASITGKKNDRAVLEESTAKSRFGRSLRQKEAMVLLEGDDAINMKALKAIRRVQDKLSGNDFQDVVRLGENLDVPEQVQRLVVQATSTENLCQLFIGWCAFW